VIVAEVILLVIAYTALVITLFTEIVCYKRNLETLETILFTASLLLLIISLTVSPLIDTELPADHINIFVLLAMTTVGFTTPLNVFTERKNSVNAIWRKIVWACGSLIFLITIVSYFFNLLIYSQYLVSAFLLISVLASMIIVLITKPSKRLAQREKTDRMFAVSFMVLVPLSLVASYFLDQEDNLKIGFLLPVVFILLSASKLIDDLQRLGFINTSTAPQEQHFQNYLLSEREKEIANLLVLGKSYKQISEELYIAMPTVKTHVSNVYKKCGTSSRSELTALLIK
jgi:DNA-binding CsgD family transcriptional regulator